MRKLKYLIIHCTDTPAGRKVTRQMIEQWHIKERGWSRVGYSDMIHLDGKLENLIPFNQDDKVDSWEVSNGAAGYNSKSRHVVYVGGKGGDTRTFEQKETLLIYVKYMLIRHPDIKIIGHNEVSSKLCPAFDVKKWCLENCINEKNTGL